MRIFFRFTFLLIVFSYVFETTAQIPAGYYDATAGLTGLPLKTALYNIIKGHTSVSYAQLWTSFQTTDKTASGKVWDMYSDIPGGTAPYTFTFSTDQCGSYSAEGDCYNREHSFPNSWFGGITTSVMYTDLFHLVPTDGYVNNRRSNYPLGDVNTATWSSQNGSKLGSCSDAGYTGTVFEPVDSFKGDFARIYFYMATRYENVIATWYTYSTEADAILSNNSGLVYETWYINMLLAWNAMDPVSAKEKIRNNKVYTIQNNRNPYVDHPEWVNAVWGPSSGINNVENNISISVFPNPVSNIAHINLSRSFKKPYELCLFKTDGTTVFTKYKTSNEEEIDFSGLPDGVYFISVKSESFIQVEKIVVLK
jgi:endonuclease I